MADNESRSPQLEFSFTFDNVEDHIESEVVPRLDNDEKTLPAADSETISEPVKDELVRQFNEEQYHKDFGAWLSFERRLSLKSRQEFNTLAQEIIKKPSAEITGTDRASLRYYSGFGGTGQDNERGVLYDYYTSPPVAGMMWQLLHKIKPIHTGSHILEPSCGTGVFFATAPDDVVLHGVELNPRTAAVARILHPSAHIRNMSFESFNISRLKTYGYDYLIGNAPFGERSADTRFLDMPKEKSLDRYFVSRGIDALKPEGVMALIVHPGVLQNETNESFRTGILRKAWFIGAVRLNDHSFAHSNTNIQPDLLFFQRHPEDIEQSLAAIPGPEVPEVLNAPFNTTYYRLYPQHVMGTISEGSGQWGQDEVHGLITADTLAKVVSDFTPLADANIREQIYENIREKYPAGRTGREKEPDISPASPSTAYHLKLDENEAKDVTSRELQRGSLKIHDHALYVLSDDFIWNRSSDSPDLVNRMKTVLELSHTVRRIRMIMQEREPGESKAVQQQALQSLENYKHEFGTYPQYDPHLLSFIKKFPAVSGIYEGMIDPLTPVISEDNIYRTTHALVNGHNPAIDALYTLREHLQAATREAIHRWFPHDADNLIQEMDKHPDVFLTPENEYQLREDYLSGNVWEKIDELEKLKVKHSQDPDITGRYTRYQDELRKATNWTTLEEAHITPHLSWISESVVNSFLHSEYCPRHSLFRLKTVAKNEEGKWGVINGKKEWEPFNDPVIYYLNYQKQRGKYVDTEMFNKEYNEAFSSFISNDPQYRDTIENTFNRLFNAEVKSPVKTYPVFIDGWTHAKTPKPHQMQSFHHLYRQQKGLSALGTGFGKTLVAISLYSVLKQEGKINRAFFQVPNNKVKDWVQEFTDVMPSLRIGYIDPEMPGYASREKRYAAYHRLANTPYDLLIFPESSAGEIQLNPQNDRFIVGNVISRHLKGNDSSTARMKESIKNSVNLSLQNGKTNKTITFEDFGCDALFVDEAHRYKNLFTSGLSREIGINDGRQSAKALSLFKKTASIRHDNDDKNVFLFTATPLTNSPLEYYNILMLLAPRELEKFNIFTIDQYIHNFANIEESEIYDWKSGQITMKKILTGFNNVHTLQDIFFKYTDYQNDPKSINLEKPDPVHTPNIIPKNDLQASAVQEISSNLEKFSQLPLNKREIVFPHQNYLTFYTKLRTASLDIELYDPVSFKNWRNPKLDTLASNAWNIFQKTGAGQLIFCDRVFSSDNSFNIHDKIKSYLVEKGFVSAEIAVINGCTKSGGTMSDSETEKLISKTVAEYNNGKYKILIGTTGCIGESLNLQQNSSSVHHFDIPFRPSDFIQRNGRVDRQGNMQGKVHIFTYMSSGTIDNYSVNLVQNKANWIDELLKTKTNVFVNKNDESSINADELLLALSEEYGNAEKIKELREKMQKEAEAKLAQAKEEKRKSLILSLAKLRNPIVNYHGDTTSFSYQQRREKIKNIEKQLLALPSFVHKEIIGGKQPFLYAPEQDCIVMKGDYVSYAGDDCIVHILDTKKQTMSLRNIRDATGPDYELRLDDLPPPAESLSDTREYAYNYFKHLPDKRFLDALTKTTDTDFYTLPDNDLKEKLYYQHISKISDKQIYPVPSIRISEEQDTSAYHVVISRETSFGYTHTRYANPFSPDTLDKIKNAATLSFDNTYTDHTETFHREILEAFKHNLPQVFHLISEKLLTTPPDIPYVLTSDMKNPRNFKRNLAVLCAYPYFHNDSLSAANLLIEKIPDERRESFKQSLLEMGCLDKNSTREIIDKLSRGLSPGEPPQNTHTNKTEKAAIINFSGHANKDKFVRDHFRITGVNL